MKYCLLIILFCCFFSVSAQKRDSILSSDTTRIHLNQIKLNGVTIRGQKPLIEQRVDGITFNVANLPSAAGSDAADILKRVPMVAVNPAGEISIRGSTNIKVLIDGNPSDIYGSSVANVLKAIRGENIVKVEVITHPSAKYDAEGTDAVINIITRKIRNNITNGSIGATAGNHGGNLEGEIHNKIGKWLFNADALYQRYWNKNGSVMQRTTDNMQLIQKNETQQTGYYFFGGGNIIYTPDTLNTFSIGYRLQPTSETTTGTADNYQKTGAALTPLFLSNTITPDRNIENSFNIAYTGNSINGHRTFSFLVNYGLSTNNGGYQLNQLHNNVIDYKENLSSNTNNNDFLIQADYSQTFNNNWKWESGIKASGKEQKSASMIGVYDFLNDNYNTDASRSNNFDYQSNIYAAYSNLTLTFKKWGLTTGVRYEKTVLNAAFKDLPLHLSNFDNLAPQILASYMFNNKSSLKIGYSMKIARPDFSYLNPTVNKSDSLTTQVGNPYLKPEITNRYEINYTVNDRQLFKDIVVFFNDNRNSIENIRTPLPGGLFESTWENAGINQSLGLSATLNWKPMEKFNLGATFTSQYVWLKSQSLGIANNGLTRALTFNSTYSLPKGYSIYLYGFFNNRSLSLQGYRTGWKYYSLTISKKSADERFNLSLKMDAFLTPYSYIDEYITGANFQQLQTYRYQNQNFSLSFTYKIGKQEIKTPRMLQPN